MKRNLKQVIPHPNYNQFTFDNDIALMELDSPVSYSDYIRPICLPAPQHVFPPGNTVWITGWGATREGGELKVNIVFIYVITKLKNIVFNLSSKSLNVIIIGHKEIFFSLFFQRCYNFTYVFPVLITLPV